MKHLFNACLLFCISYLNSYTQIGGCPPDTLFLGGSPTFAQQTDSLDSPMLPCYNYDCKALHCHSWQLPQNFIGHLELTSPNPLLLPLSVQIWDGCHYVRFEDCVSVGASSTVDWDTNLVFPTSCQVVVCNSMDAVTITIKPGPATDTLPIAFLYVDTLCGALIPIDEPQQPESAYYYPESEIRQAGLSGKRPIPVKGSERLPNVGYIKAGRVYGDHE